MNDYGTVNFEGKTYKLEQQAYVENYKDGVAYFARATDENGDEYEVIWLTTTAWDNAQEYDQLQREQEAVERFGHDFSDEKAERLAELEEMALPSIEDESNACDWDNPYLVNSI